MEGLLSFLLFAGLFYLMMRFGCGAHMVHGHGGSSTGQDPDHVDPVCGMQIPSHEGYGKMHSGHLYRFCSRKCLDAFDADPSRYTRSHEEVSP